MGGTAWSSVSYMARTEAKHETYGTSFAYSATETVKPRSDWKVHPDLDPAKRNKAGQVIRESRDSEANPTSLAIGVILDVTGSMNIIPGILQRKLPMLRGMLLRRGAVEYPHILYGAVGDATCDRIPLQLGQFESGNEGDENLENVVLEGGGGGGVTESYELPLYFFANYTSIDCWEKRGHKGYLFVIGDERPYSHMSESQVHSLMGVQGDSTSVEDVIAKVKERYELFFITPETADKAHFAEIQDFWKTALGQNYLRVADTEAIPELIATTIGTCEGITLSEAIHDLKELGTSNTTVKAVSTALEMRTATGSQTGPATSVGTIPGLTSESGATRL